MQQILQCSKLNKMFHFSITTWLLGFSLEFFHTHKTILSFNFIFPSLLCFLLFRRLEVLKLLNSSNLLSCCLLSSRPFVNVPFLPPVILTPHFRFLCLVTHRWLSSRCWKQSSNTSALLPSVYNKVGDPR